VFNERERQERIKNGNYALVYTVIQDGKILLEERLNPRKKYYGLITVLYEGIKKGEPLWQSFEKKFESEHGTFARTVEFLDEFTHNYQGVNYKRYFFLVTGTSGKIEARETDGCRRFWATIEEARRLCSHPHTHDFIAAIESFIAGAKPKED
jgi:hypothetical protein